MAATTITSKEHFQEFIDTAKPVAIVDYWAPWCNPCELMADEFAAVTESMEGQAAFATVNIDELKDVALLQDVMGVPTIVLYRDGEEVDRIAGFKKANVLEKLLTSMIAE